MADQQKTDDAGPRFIVPLPGGGIARLPLTVLRDHAVEGKPSHGPRAAAQRGTSSTVRAGGSQITINVYAGSGEVSVEEDGGDDVVAHSLSVDATTGTSEWHTDWEYGECDYTDDAGFPQRIHAWHRHPFGTEYTELYEG